MTFTIKSYPSPNIDARPAGTDISAIVLHTGEGTRKSDLEALTGPNGGNPVSSHYYVCRNGEILQLADDSMRTWHAGAGVYLGLYNWNNFSIGIETEHKLGQDWPTIQKDALRWLCLQLIAKHGIEQSMIIAHRWLTRPPGASKKYDPTNWPDPSLSAWIAALYVQPLGLLVQHPPRISRNKFATILRDFNSPAAALADEAYQICVDAGIDPAVALAFFGKESTFGRFGKAVENKNWGNVKTPFDPALTVPSTNGFARYLSWSDSLEDWCNRINERYVKERGLTTVETIVPVYAPAVENDVDGYIKFVLDHVASWSTDTTTYRVLRDVNIRQAPTTASPIAGVAVKGEEFVGKAVQGKAPPGKTDRTWIHRVEDQRGFVYISGVEEVV